MITLDSIVRALGISPHDDGVSYRVVLSSDQVHLGINASGCPALLVPLGQAPARRNFVHGDIRLTTHERVRFQLEGSARESAAIVVTCLDRDRPQSFSVFLLDLVHRLRDATEPPLVVIDSAIREWHDMLTRRARLTREGEIGLWGELALLRILPNVDRGLAAWTGPSGDSVDFRGGGVALECKTSTDPWRHIVSLDQVNQVQADHAETYMVSSWIGVDAAGASLPELVEVLEAQLTDQPAFRQRLLRVGYSHDQAGLYDERYALLRDPTLVAMADVPRVHQIDLGVSQVRFTVSLERCDTLNTDRVRSTLARLSEDPTT